MNTFLRTGRVKRAGLILLVLVCSAGADTNIWVGSVNSNFNIAANWSLNSVPDSGGVVLMDGTGIGPGGEYLRLASDVTVAGRVAGFSGDTIDLEAGNWTSPGF